jgi:tellurite resistance protein TerC
VVAASDFNRVKEFFLISSIGNTGLWVGFIAFVLAMLAVDLGLFQRRAHQPSLRESLAWTIVWVGLALLFNAGVYVWFGPQAGLEFLTGYLIEKALSVDNLFVFLVVFSYFAVPPALQHRVLFWGILGALVMRGLFIAAGTALLQSFHWMLYVFGAFLLLTGIRLLVRRERGFSLQHNRWLRLFARLVPVVSEYRGGSFTVVESGRRCATPLLLSLVAVEASDLVFAVDSIPAIFAITRDPFIVFTSNVFAILGLRSLYFLLAGAMSSFRYLGTGLALVLGFVGLKMLLSSIYELPVGWSLAIVTLLIAGSILLSLRHRLRNAASRRGAPVMAK